MAEELQPKLDFTCSDWGRVSSSARCIAVIFRTVRGLRIFSLSVLVPFMLVSAVHSDLSIASFVATYSDALRAESAIDEEG